MAEIPQLAGLFNKYESEGFHIVALEVQGSSEADISGMLKGRGAKYQATTGGQLKGAKVSGIPHGYLFGADGKLVDGNVRGHGLEKQLKDLLKDAAGFLAGPGPYVKLAPQAAQIKTGMGFAGVLKTLATKKESKDAAEAAEAKMMYDSLKNGGEDLLARAIAKKADDPIGALKGLDKVAQQFTGDEIGTKAKAEADAMRKDPAVKKEIEASAMLAQLERANEALKPVRGEKNPKNEDFRKVNALGIQQVVGGCMALVKKYEGTKAAAAAQELMDQYR